MTSHPSLNTVLPTARSIFYLADAQRSYSPYASLIPYRRTQNCSASRIQTPLLDAWLQGKHLEAPHRPYGIVSAPHRDLYLPTGEDAAGDSIAREQDL